MFKDWSKHSARAWRRHRIISCRDNFLERVSVPSPRLFQIFERHQTVVRFSFGAISARFCRCKIPLRQILHSRPAFAANSACFKHVAFLHKNCRYEKILLLLRIARDFPRIFEKICEPVDKTCRLCKSSCGLPIAPRSIFLSRIF